MSIILASQFELLPDLGVTSTIRIIERALKPGRVVTGATKLSQRTSGAIISVSSEACSGGSTCERHLLGQLDPVMVALAKPQKVS
jgi:hypothetical protein